MVSNRMAFQGRLRREVLCTLPDGKMDEKNPFPFAIAPEVFMHTMGISLFNPYREEVTPRSLVTKLSSCVLTQKHQSSQ